MNTKEQQTRLLKRVSKKGYQLPSLQQILNRIETPNKDRLKVIGTKDNNEQ